MSLKLVEVLVLVCAGALFVWWQMRDLRIAREQTRRQKADAVMASAAKQTSEAGELASDGSPLRCAPRDDGSAHTEHGDGPQGADAVIASEEKQSSIRAPSRTDGGPHAP